MQKPRILVIGGVCVVQTLNVESFPDQSGYCDAESFDCLPGGNGTAASVALSRLAADSLICSAIGDDTYGKDMKEYLEAEGVDTRFLSEKKGECTCLHNIIERAAKTDKVFFRGAMTSFKKNNVEEAFITYPDGVILHGDIPENIIEETAAQAIKNNIPLFISGIPDQSKYPLSNIESCEILIVDYDEALHCTGIRPSDQERCMKACISLMKRVKAKYVIILLEGRGSFIYDGTYYDFIPAYDVPHSADIDISKAFSTALISEYLRAEGDIRRACDFATIVTALYLTRGGGLRAYPRLSEVKRFIVRNDLDFSFE